MVGQFITLSIEMYYKKLINLLVGITMSVVITFSGDTAVTEAHKSSTFRRWSCLPYLLSNFLLNTLCKHKLTEKVNISKF